MAVEAISHDGSEEVSTENGDASNSSTSGDSFRFDEETVEEFNSSSEGKTLIYCFFGFSLFYMWPYQTMVQTQTLLTLEFPERADSAGFVMMICTTWPMFLTHTALVVTGLGRRLPYSCKLIMPSAMVVVLAISLIVILQTVTDPGVLLSSLYTAALIESIAESFTEPAVYDMAGLMPSPMTSQAVQAGNGACGAIVSLVQMLTRLITNGLGPMTKEQVASLTKIFFVLMALTGIAIIYMYKAKIKNSPYYAKYVATQDSYEGVDENADESSDPSRGCPGNEDKHGSPMKATMEAITHVWPSALAIVLTYVLSLTLWPVIPGRTCVVSPSAGDDTLQTWWFDIIIFSFNLSDYIGKSLRRTLRWGAKTLTPTMQLGLAALRMLIFLPLILTGSAPQLYSPEVARWVVFLGVFFLGITNGWLSTVCFMRAPKALPPGTRNEVAEQASAVLVIGLFVGISFGCLFAYLLGRTVLHGHLGVCYGA